VTVARLRELGLTPDTRLGQHFLVDDNLVRVALRLADLRPDDVVLEVGPGLGVLTVALAGAVALVHAVEIDRRLAPALQRTLEDHANVRLLWADAMSLDGRSLDPAPTAFVSNLPYQVSTPLIVESLGGLPHVDRWAVMVQREAAERLFAREGTPRLRRRLGADAPGLRADGRPRRLAGGLRPAAERRLDADRIPAQGRLGRPGGPLAGRGPRGARRVLPPSEDAPERAPAQRRGLARSGGGGARGAGPATRGAGRGAPAGPLPGPRGAARRVTVGARIVRAPAKINLVLRVGPRRSDGYHELISLMTDVPVSDTLSVATAPRTRVTCPALPDGDTLVTSALALLVEAAGHEGGFRVRIDKRLPVGAGLGGGSSDAGAALRAANLLLPRPVPDATLRRIAAQTGSDVSFFLDDGPALVRGRGEDTLRTGLPLPRCAVALAWPGVPLATRDVYAAYRPHGPVPPIIRQPPTLDELARAVHNDLGETAERLEPRCRALREELQARGALAAAVAGSGSAVFGLFRDAASAERALQRLPGAAWTSHATLGTR
jgi:4-diphosphocytidyl-2-C-methyl-D-erythritol kinase